MNENYLKQPFPADYMSEEAIRAVIEGAKKTPAITSVPELSPQDQANLDEELSLIREEEEMLSQAEASSNNNLKRFISTHSNSRKERDAMEE